MKPITLNKDSHHFRLATVYGDLSKRDITDYGVSICEYLRHVAKGFLKTLLITGVVGVAIGSVADFIIAIVISIMIAPVGELHFLGILGATIVICVAIVPCIILGLTFMDYLQIKRREKPMFHKPSFIGLAYRSIKNKICFKVNFK